MGNPCKLFVDLIDHHNNFQVQFERFFQYISRLWHRPFLGVYNKQCSIRHRERPFYLTRKICVSRSIDNINFRLIVKNSTVFGENRNSAFSLERITIQNCRLTHFSRVLTEGMSLFEHRIHQRCLTMINVCNYCHITNIFEAMHTNNFP